MTVTDSTLTASYAESSDPVHDRLDRGVMSRRTRETMPFIPATLTGAIMLAAFTVSKPATLIRTNWASGTIHQQPIYAVDRMAALVSEISSFRNLNNNWDGEGGYAPSHVAVVESLQFIDLLPISAIPPKASVSGDGEIAIYWKSDDDFINVSFYGDGHIYFYARVKEVGVEVDGVETYSRESIPRSLATAISEFRVA